ncbi:MAG: FAD-dependent monooxygenase [Burkholderiales bacterium]|nr:FAD-dependent monooxygenase [Burkholderiales bacterium]
MKIVILGAGVAGVSTAILLKQRGMDVHVYERRTAVTNIGAGIVIWPNAAWVLDQMGILPAMQAASGQPQKMQRWSQTGEDLGAINIQTINQEIGYASLAILRSDFQNIMMDRMTALDIPIHYHHAASSISTTDDGKAVVQFLDGRQIDAGIIIGADGRMASCARRFVCGDNTPVYQGFINWVGVCENMDLQFDPVTIADYWGVGERFGIVPVNQHLAYWAAGRASASISQDRHAAHSVAHSADLASFMQDWPQVVSTIIRATPDSRINKIFVHDHHPTTTWHRQNVLMIGDAAHASLPTSGQGACQALEDAWHLAESLAKHDGDLEQTFSQFTALRFAKTTGITMAGRGLASSIFNMDPQFCAGRNDQSKTTDYHAVALAMANGWSQHLPKAA